MSSSLYTQRQKEVFRINLKKLVLFWFLVKSLDLWNFIWEISTYYFYFCKIIGPFRLIPTNFSFAVQIAFIHLNRNSKVLSIRNRIFSGIFVKWATHLPPGILSWCYCLFLCQKKVTLHQKKIMCLKNGFEFWRQIHFTF